MFISPEASWHFFGNVGVFLFVLKVNAQKGIACVMDPDEHTEACVPDPWGRYGAEI